MENLINQDFRQVIESGRGVSFEKFKYHNIVDEKYRMPLIVNYYSYTLQFIKNCTDRQSVIEDFIKNTYTKIHKDKVKFVISIDSNNAPSYLQDIKIDNVLVLQKGIDTLIDGREITIADITIDNDTISILQSFIQIDIENNFDESLNTVFKTFILSKTLGKTMTIDNTEEFDNLGFTETMLSIFNLIIECPDDINKNDTDWKKLYLMFAYSHHSRDAIESYYNIIVPMKDFNSLISQYIPLIEKIKPSLKAEGFKDLSDVDKKLLAYKLTFGDNPDQQKLDFPTVYVIGVVGISLLLGAVTTGIAFAVEKNLQETILQTALAKVLLGICVSMLVGIMGILIHFSEQQKLSCNQNLGF